MKVLVFGSANIDHVYNLNHMVKEGETQAAEAYAKNMGGKGFNQAIALKKAGADTYFAGSIGLDGMFMKDELNTLGINTSFLKIAHEPTGHAIIQVDKNGKNSIIIYGGANKSITSEQIESTLSAFDAGDVVVLQNEINGTGEIIKKAKEKGLIVVFNPSPITNDMFDFPLDLVDIFVMNEVEGEVFTNKTEPYDAVSVFMEKYKQAKILLTLGERGSVYYNKEEVIRQDAERVTPVDTTAAGDTFEGYFIAAILRGVSDRRALRLATRAATMAIQMEGAAVSIPWLNEVEA